uniref:Uncharacterized protein n=1 Tax=mine drainage metagenome TaxID=410659 RepID=E6QBD3_9ZZZZ
MSEPQGVERQRIQDAKTPGQFS